MQGIHKLFPEKGPFFEHVYKNFEKIEKSRKFFGGIFRRELAWNDCIVYNMSQGEM